ncbi:unnamed protein product [Phytophthora lilii]|uniref:Unnamed protein product n=1 Tax=Phytophthora lilii TaxID=2077276 RepID=A0A9W6WX89_9STRA|nr:unnamed protein product [Phytophthora lilii]
MSSPVDTVSPRLRSVSSADSESEDVTSRSLDAHGRSRHSLHEDELEQEAHGTPTQGHSKSHHHIHHHNGGGKGSLLAKDAVLASASSSRNASGNLRYTQFEQLLEKEVVDLDQLRKLSWGGVPTKHRPTVWRLLLACDLSTVSDENLHIVEADSYWCLTKLLDDIQDHYTFAQPGLQRMVQRMEELVHRCDAELFEHIVERENVQFVQFAFRWMNCLLMRELPLDGIVRIWDTYLCEDSGFESFHVYVCAAILMTFGEKLKTLEFQDLVLFLQSLPTKDWVENEIEPLLSRAFILQTYFADAPSHLTSQAPQ